MFTDAKANYTTKSGSYQFSFSRFLSNRLEISSFIKSEKQFRDDERRFTYKFKAICRESTPHVVSVLG